MHANQVDMYLNIYVAFYLDNRGLLLAKHNAFKQILCIYNNSRSNAALL